MKTDGDKILQEFFISDKKLTPAGNIRHSVLLAIKRDLDISLAVYKEWKALELTSIQHKALEKFLPPFPTISLYTSAIDLLARVLFKRSPRSSETGIFFRTSASKLFEFNDDEVNELWKLRNDIVHSYSINVNHGVSLFGSSKIIEKEELKYRFYLRPMRSSVIQASEKLYQKILKDDEVNKQETVIYLLDKGFFYSQAI